MYLLSFMWQVLTVAQGIISIVTDKRGHFRQGNLFLFQSTQHQLPRYRTASPNSQWLMQGTTSYISPWYLVCIYDLPCHVAGQRPKIDFDRKWTSEINQPDTHQQQLYTNFWLNRTLYTPKHHRTTTIYLPKNLR
jgi:hypothetical protein